MVKLRFFLIAGLVYASVMLAAAAEDRPLDLAPYAQEGNAFPNVPKGDLSFDGIRFQLGNFRVPINPGGMGRLTLDSATCQSIHVLHYTESTAERVGAYILEYEDGERVEIPLLGGMTIQDWWLPSPLAFGALVYEDTLLHEGREQPIGFWRFSFLNPRPDVPLTAFETRNTDGRATINVMALTLSDVADDKIGGVSMWMPGMDDEQLLLAVLGIPGTPGGKIQACQQLARMGSVTSVPALAALLDDEDESLAYAARFALESMEFPEAGAALRDALATAAGVAKVGIIESLGAREDKAAVPLLIPLLEDPGPVVASATALALGKIGGPEAITGLGDHLPDCKPECRGAMLDAWLTCAQGLDGQAALDLYGDIADVLQPANVQIAVACGLIRANADNQVELLEGLLTQGNSLYWQAALPAVREVGGPEATQTFADCLGRASDELVIPLIGALAQRGDPAAAPAIAARVKDSEPAIRIAALHALVDICDASSAPVLVDVAAHGDESEQALAETALGRLEAIEALTALLKTAEPAEQVVLVRTLATRDSETVRPALLGLVENDSPDVATAALLALGSVGIAADAKPLCELIQDSEDVHGRDDAVRALVQLGTRLEAPSEFVDIVLLFANSDDLVTRCAMLDACGVFCDPRLLDAVVAATSDEDEQVQDAAIRALAGSPDPDAVPHLLALLDTEPSLTHHVLILRGIARLAANPVALDATSREEALRRGLAAAQRNEEKKLLLGALGSCHTTGALDCAESYADDEALTAEAILAWTHNAEALAASHRERVGRSARAISDKARQIGSPDEVKQALLDIVQATCVEPVSAEQVRFEKILVDKKFRSEGVAVADVNRDGANDILAGDVWYEAPNWTVHEVRPPKEYVVEGGYSECFANFVADVDADGWVDSIVVGFPGAPAYWYRNPGDPDAGHWPEFLLAEAACGETPLFGDILNEGYSLPVFGLNKRMTWFMPQWDRTAVWHANPVTQEHPSFDRFGHGQGLGDINGDGRVDIISTAGWWEAPMDPHKTDWPFHKASLGPAAATMHAYDVDGDGDNDVLSSAAHEYGIWWFEQQQDDGEPTFVQHDIYKGLSQTHALELADINNDGLMDLITGKRYFAHNGHDPGGHEPALLLWFELQRSGDGTCNYVPHEIDNDSGVGTQFTVCDFDQDGLTDIVTSNKKGVHVFLQRRED